MSVRSIPDKAEVQRAEQLYKDVRENRASLPATPRLKPVARVSRYVWASNAILLPTLIGSTRLSGPAAWAMLGASCIGLLGIG